METCKGSGGGTRTPDTRIMIPPPACRNEHSQQHVTESADGVLPENRPSQSNCSLPEDADFARLMEAWPGLPGHVRAAVMALVDAARKDGRGAAGDAAH